MNYIKRSLLVVIFLQASYAKVMDYKYETIKQNNHIVHIVYINPKLYKIELVKAHGQKIGRETVLQMATRSNVNIAINGGFFEIGNGVDGAPSGTLIVNGTVYGIKNIKQALIVINDDEISIKKENPQVLLKQNSKSLTNLSIVSGIPTLVIGGKINETIRDKDSAFYNKPHARTALGIKENGTIALVIVEHPYKQDLISMTLGEVQSFILKNKEKIVKKYGKPVEELTLIQLKALLKESFAISNGGHGMTIIELAKFMQSIGCHDAINLDGGGSSTLVLDKKTVNQTFGDKDESNGIKIARSVSDAIIFRKR